MERKMDLKDLTGKSLDVANDVLELNQQIIGWKIFFESKGVDMTINQKLDVLINFMEKQQEFNKRLEGKVDKNSTNIEKMMNTTTMKKELA